MKEKETFYDGGFSHDAKQKVFIQGTPRTPKGSEAEQSALDDVRKWEIQIQRQINRAIPKDLHEIKENEQCNLFVTFYIDKTRFHESFSGIGYPDIDNLLKVLFDSLKRKEGEKLKSNQKRLIPDDVSFRGVRAEREMVETKPEEGVDIEYVITKTFEIEEVIAVGRERVKELFRSYWDYPMQHITAYDMKGNKCRFIDNAPGRLFLAKPGDIDAKFIPPGYNWGDKIGKRVDGCMVFKKEILETQRHLGGNQDLLHWLTKW